MKNLIIILIALAAIQSCSQSGRHDATNQEKNTNSPADELTSCYSWMKDSSSISLQITVSGNVATGNLTYDLYEKDKNSGTIKGALHGDTLFADYDFMSEGKLSTREVSFLKTVDGMKEGYGPMEEQNGKMVFTNKSAIDFSGNMLLQKTVCK